jgi:outer membrane receptor protein involved in Fe transport
LTAGLRNDYSEDYDAEWSPRLGLVCKPSAETEIYASFNQAHRAPSLSDRFVKVEYNGLLFEGNPNLKPETLTAFEIGGRRRFGNRVTTEAAAFHNHLKDMFDYILGSDGVFQNQNITAVTTYGAEAAVSWQITQATSAFLNYTHTEGIYDEFPSDPQAEGNRLAYLAADKATFGLQYTANKGLSSGLECRYVGPRHGDPQNTSPNRMDSYVVADWHGRVPVGHNAFLTLRLDNIFDTAYQDYPGQDQPGRNFMIGAEMTF